MSWKNIIKEDREKERRNLMDNPIVRGSYNKARDKDMSQKFKKNLEFNLEMISWAKENDLWEDELEIEQTIDKVLNLLDDSKLDEAKSLYDTIKEPLQRLYKRWSPAHPLW